jgi:hypothetical protein
MKLMGGGSDDETSMAKSEVKTEIDEDLNYAEEVPDDFDPEKDPLGRFGFGILSFIRL